MKIITNSKNLTHIFEIQQYAYIIKTIIILVLAIIIIIKLS